MAARIVEKRREIKNYEDKENVRITKKDLNYYYFVFLYVSPLIVPHILFTKMKTRFAKK